MSHPITKEVINFLLSGEFANSSEEKDFGEITPDQVKEIIFDVDDHFNISRFNRSNDLDCYSKFKDIEYVIREHYSLYQLIQVIGSSVNQPWMVAQACSLAALSRGEFTFHFPMLAEPVRANYSWPCIMKDANHIIIPCRTKNNGVFIICDEYWGFPIGAIDFKNSQFSFCSSSSNELLRSDSPEGAIKVLLENLIVWFFYEKKNRPSVANNIQQGEVRSFLFVGGAPNPSHIIWNYIGGYDLLARSGRNNLIDSVIISSDLLFKDPFKGKNVIDVSSLSQIDRIKNLSENGVGSGLCVRLTDGAINSKVCERIYADSVRNMFYETTETPSDDRIGKFSEKKAKRIAVTIRSGTRQLDQQVEVFPLIFKGLIEKYNHLEILFDGSSSGSWSHEAVDQDIAKGIVDRFRSLYPDFVDKIVFNSVIGRPINYQILAYRTIDSFLSYVSGGNVKLIGFSSVMGVLMGPSSKVVSSSGLDIENACLRTKMQKEIASVCFQPSQIFCMSHDFVGYESTFYPPLLCTGSTIKNEDGLSTDKDDFNSNFTIEPNELLDALISSIRYNQYTNISLRGDLLQ